MLALAVNKERNKVVALFESEQKSKSRGSASSVCNCLSLMLSRREEARWLTGVEENLRPLKDQVCTEIQTVFCSQRRL